MSISLCFHIKPNRIAGSKFQQLQTTNPFIAQPMIALNVSYNRLRLFCAKALFNVYVLRLRNSFANMSICENNCTFVRYTVSSI